MALNGVLTEQRNLDRETWRQGDSLARDNRQMNALVDKMGQGLNTSTAGQFDGGNMATLQSMSGLGESPDRHSRDTSGHKTNSAIREYREEVKASEKQMRIKEEAIDDDFARLVK